MRAMRICSGSGSCGGVVAAERGCDAVVWTVVEATRIGRDTAEEQRCEKQSRDSSAGTVITME
jgi:hypothetical protein